MFKSQFNGDNRNDGSNFRHSTYVLSVQDPGIGRTGRGGGGSPPPPGQIKPTTVVSSALQNCLELVLEVEHFSLFKRAARGQDQKLEGGGISSFAPLLLIRRKGNVPTIVKKEYSHYVVQKVFSTSYLQY